MPVVTSEVLFDRLLADDQRKVMFRFVDDVGKEHRTSWRYVALDYDEVAGLAAMTIKVNQSLKGREIGNIVGMVTSSKERNVTVDYMTPLLNPTETTSKDIAKHLIRLMMKLRDPLLVIWLEPLILYIRANYTAPQVATFLDMTPEQVTRMNTRINNILDNKVDILAFNDSAEEIR